MPRNKALSSDKVTALAETLVMMVCVSGITWRRVTKLKSVG